MKNNLSPSLALRMQNVRIKLLLAVVLSSFSFAFFPASCFAQSTVIDSLGDAYFFHVNDYPNNQSPFWGDDDALTNGIAHDDKYWYIAALATTLIGTPNGDWGIRKIPVSRDLMADNSEPPNNTVRKSDVPALSNYGHAGDLDCCLYNGKYYLVVPFTGDGLPPVVAFFRASDLKFMNYAKLTGQRDVGWCAVPRTNNLRLFSSRDRTNTIRQYRISWDTILNHPSNRHGLIFTDSSFIRGKQGDKVYLNNMQGGEFTPDGKMLYVSCGIIDCLGKGGPQQYEDGINVINTANWRLIQQSSNKAVETNPAPGSPIRAAKSGCFDYTFDNTGCSGEEPEGLTIWDMDEVPGHDSHVSGQLHVISYNHNTSVFNENKVFLKHYKRFKFPKDITVFGTTAANGEPRTNPAIGAFLNRGTIFANCASVLYNNPPNIFPPGKTPVVFTVTDNKTVKVQDTAYVTVINRHDECTTALQLYEYDKTIADNYCATTSTSIAVMAAYPGVIKDVWFKIIPSTTSLSVETYQVPGGLTNTVMQVFFGSCDSLREISSDDNSGDADHAKITFTNLINLNPIYIRITDYGGNDYGKFGITYKRVENNVTTPGNNSFTLYPNPTSRIIQLKTDAPGEFEVSIFDIAGRLMLPKAKFTSTKKFDLSSLANGIYYVHIYDSNADKRVIKKIVKTN